MTLLHATGVVRDGAAVLLTGPPGAGKSDLALRLIDRGWRLLADDQVSLSVEADVLIARAPPTTRGMIEVRGVGIVALNAIDTAPVALIIALGSEPERLPEPATQTVLGVAVPSLTLDPWTASVALKLEYAFARARIALQPGQT